MAFSKEELIGSGQPGGGFTKQEIIAAQPLNQPSAPDSSNLPPSPAAPQKKSILSKIGGFVANTAKQILGYGDTYAKGVYQAGAGTVEAANQNKLNEDLQKKSDAANKLIKDYATKIKAESDATKKKALIEERIAKVQKLFGESNKQLEKNQSILLSPDRVTPGQMIGATAGVVSTLAPVASTGGFLARLGKNAAIGAVGGAAQPLLEKKNAGEIVKGAGQGAAFNAVLGSIFKGKKTTPVATEGEKLAAVLPKGTMTDIAKKTVTPTSVFPAAESGREVLQQQFSNSLGRSVEVSAEPLLDNAGNRALAVNRAGRIIIDPQMFTKTVSDLERGDTVIINGQKFSKIGRESLTDMQNRLVKEVAQHEAAHTATLSPKDFETMNSLTGKKKEEFIAMKEAQAVSAVPGEPTDLAATPQFDTSGGIGRPASSGLIENAKPNATEFPSASRVGTTEGGKAVVSDMTSATNNYQNVRRSMSIQDRQAVVQKVYDAEIRQLESLRPGDPVNRLQAEALASGASKAADQVAEINNAVQALGATDGPIKLSDGTTYATKSDALIAKDIQSFILSQRMSGLVSGTSEAGAVLNVAKQALLETSGGGPLAKGFNKMFKDLAKDPRLLEKFQASWDAVQGDPLKQFEVLRNFSQYGFGDVVSAAVYNSLLSGLWTPVRNMVGNTFHMLALTGEHAINAGLDATISAFTGREREVFLNEVLPGIAGLQHGFGDGFRQFTEIWNKGYSPKAILEGEIPQISALRGKVEFLNKPTYLAKASDALSSSMLYSQKISQLATRIATKELRAGTIGENVMEQRISSLLEQPTKEMLAEAKKYALEGTFQDRGGRIAQTIIKLRDINIAGGLKPGQLVVPFVNTPERITYRGMQRIPLVGLLTALWDPSVRTASGARDLAAKQFMGAAAISAIAAYGIDKISGTGPSDPDQRRMLIESGWKPNSIKVGDHWYSYQNFVPLNTALAIIGNYNDGKQFGKKSLAGALMAVGSSTLDQSFLAGTNALVLALNDPQRYGQSFINQLATIPVPALVSQTRNLTNQETYDTTGGSFLANIGKAAASKISYTPSTAKTLGLLPKRETFGKVQTHDVATGLPIPLGGVTKDPVRIELKRIGKAISLPSKSVGGVDLTPEQYDKYQQVSGDLAKRGLDKLISMVQYKNMSDEQKANEIQNIVTAARTQAQLVLKLKPDTIKKKSPNTINEKSLIRTLGGK